MAKALLTRLNAAVATKSSERSCTRWTRSDWAFSSESLSPERDQLLDSRFGVLPVRG